MQKQALYQNSWILEKIPEKNTRYNVRLIAGTVTPVLNGTTSLAKYSTITKGWIVQTPTHREVQDRPEGNLSESLPQTSDQYNVDFYGK